jgi:hypothetical protein
MSRYYKVDAVSCQRKGSYDAEVAFKVEEFKDGESQLRTNQRVVGTGFKTREEALASAQQVVDTIEQMMQQSADRYLSQFRVAQP